MNGECEGNDGGDDKKRWFQEFGHSAIIKTIDNNLHDKNKYHHNKKTWLPPLKFIYDCDDKIIL